MKTDWTNPTICVKNARYAREFLLHNKCIPIQGKIHSEYHYVQGYFKSPSGKLWWFCTRDDRLIDERYNKNVRFIPVANFQDRIGWGEEIWPYNSEELLVYMKKIDKKR